MPGVILIIIALMVGAISGVFRRIPNQKIATGEIVSIERKKTLQSGEPMYTAYVEYYIDEVPYTIKSKFKSSSFRTGQKVQVKYNQAAPQQAIIRPNLTTYVVVFGFFVAGIVVIYLSLQK